MAGPPGLAEFRASMERLESGGRNHKPNPWGASGYFQIVPGTWGGFGGYRHAYQAPRKVQVQRANQLLTQYYRQFKDWWLVAVAWHAGPGGKNSGATRAARDRSFAYRIGDVNMRTGEYADRVVKGMKGGGGGSTGFHRGGGGGGATVQTTVGADFGAPAPMSTAEAKDAAKELYGYLGWFVDHPEVGPVLIQGAREGWGPERLQGALVNTKWWKRNSETSRQWEALQASDPATAERRLDETTLSVQLQASKFGVPINRGRSAQIARSALRFGWNPEEIQLAIAAEMRWRPGRSMKGATAQLMQNVRKTANDYLVPVTRRQEWEWARRIIAGGGTPEDVAAQFQQLSKQRFPHLARDIDKGITPSQFFAPYQNVIAETLELSPEDVNFMDQSWQPVTSFRDADSGKIRTMTMSEAARFARSKPEWLDTANAWESVTGAGDFILELFGERT